MSQHTQDPSPARNQPSPHPTPLLPPIDGLSQAAQDQFGNLIEFLREIDRLKSVERRSWLMDGSRRENSAEHSWHIALMALVLAPYANAPVNLDRVIRMLLIHDLVEIDAGDTFAYDRVERHAAAAKEDAAARRLFSFLPPPAEAEMLGLWQEFEAQSTPESIFAKAMDRLMPVLHNFFTQGATWREYNINLDQVLDLNRGIEKGSATLWTFVQNLLDQAVASGYLLPAPNATPDAAPPVQPPDPASDVSRSDAR